MKKLFLLLTITLLIASDCISQISDSTTAIPNTQLKKAIVLIELGKVTATELALQKQKVGIMQLQLANKDSIIAVLIKSNALSGAMVDSYKEVVASKNVQAELLKGQLAIMRIKDRRNKIVRWITFGLGVAAGYFIFK